MPRITSVETLRVIAILGVILIHTSPFQADLPESRPIYAWLDAVINGLARFAVPFFFVICGYFWGCKIRQGADVATSALGMIKRLLLLYGIWCLIYLLPLNIAGFFQFGSLGPVKIAYWNLLQSLANPFTLLLEGTCVHLWFLPALVCAIAITSLAVSRGALLPVCILAVLLYALGVFGRAYAATEIGVSLPFNPRNGPFFSTLLFVSGYVLSARQTHNAAVWGGFLWCAGWLLQTAEWAFLRPDTGWAQYPDFVFGTYFMGLGAALVALSNPAWLADSRLCHQGGATLGVYLLHFWFIYWLGPLDTAWDHPLWEMAYPVLVALLSFITVGVLLRWPLGRRLLRAG
jgi:surface polysaccharide O-acyltransferase-like enzyme